MLLLSSTQMLMSVDTPALTTVCSTQIMTDSFRGIDQTHMHAHHHIIDCSVPIKELPSFFSDSNRALEAFAATTPGDKFSQVDFSGMW